MIDKYAKQEGKTVQINMGAGYSYTGRVVGCDPDVGITIVDNDNKDHFLICAHGMSSPVLKKRRKQIESYRVLDDEDQKQKCDETISMVMDGIEKGVINTHDFGKVDHDASAENCSFL